MRMPIARPSTGLFRALLLPLLIAVLPIGSTVANAAGASTTSYNVLDHYTESHYRLAMRDGVKLFTTVYTPKVQSGPLPILLQRSNYMCTWPHSPPAFFAEAGYIIVFQDARGTCRSDGTFLELSPSRDHEPGKVEVDESTDSNDTIRWLLAHLPNNNGKVGLWGGSYEGFYTEASIENSPPAVKAADIEAMGDWNYHHGALMLGDNFEFYIDYKPKAGPQSPRFKYWTRDPYAFFLAAGPLANLTSQTFGRETDPNPTWADLMTHTTLDGYWKERDLLSHLRGIHAAVLNTGSWNDQYVPAGPISYYKTIQKDDPRITNLLVMGPWSHMADHYLPDATRQLGDIDFGSNPGAEYRQKVLLPFFDHYLKGKPVNLPKVFVFDTGLDVWQTYADWPPPGAVTHTLYLGANGGLSFSRPKAAAAYDEYVSDPSKPVPFMGDVPPPGQQLMNRVYMTADQRFAARRPDVLVYETQPLTEDVTVAGPVTPKLFVSTSGTDSDWVVKLIDVYPPMDPQQKMPKSGLHVSNSSAGVTPDVDLGGYELLVRGEPLRGKFRNGWDKPEPFVPGRITKVTYTESGVYHTFRKGHRIMVQIQSSMFPLADLNPQTFVNIPTATPQDFRKATEHVYRGGDTSSGVVIQTVITPSPMH
jgi:uncharacterized protein